MNRALAGKRILVTRPAAQAAGLAALIAGRGGEAVCFPLIGIAAPDDWQALDAAGARLESYTLVLFISPNAVDFGLSRLLARRCWPAGLRAAAIGPGTVRRLADFGIDDVIVPRERFDSEALLALETMQAQEVQGRRVLILRGNGGRELLADTLRARGAEVECVTCYRRTAPRDNAKVMSLLCNNQLDAVTLSSSEGLRNLLDLLDTDGRARLQALPVFVPHQRIAGEGARLGLRRMVLTAPADAGLIEGLCNYRWPENE